MLFSATVLGFIRGIYRSFVEKSLFSWFYDELLFYLYLSIAIMFVYMSITRGDYSDFLGAEVKSQLIVVVAWLLGLLVIIAVPKIFASCFGVK